jgi:hypothetical protein
MVSMSRLPESELPTGSDREGGGRILSGHPGIAELPRESEARRENEEFRFPRPIINELPKIAELPRVANEETVSGGGTNRALAAEVFALRQRVYAMESSSYFARLGFGGLGHVVGGPSEIPRISELEEAPAFRKYWPNELPQESLAQRIDNIETRLTAIESNLLNSIQGLSAKVEGLKSNGR